VCELQCKSGRASLLLFSWGWVADGVAPDFGGVKHFWHDNGIVEVVC
jgi:hypothetical protein